MNLYVKAPNADRYEWIFNGASVGSASTYNIRVDPSTYVWGLPVLVHNRHSTVANPVDIDNSPLGELS